MVLYRNPQKFNAVSLKNFEIKINYPNFEFFLPVQRRTDLSFVKGLIYYDF